MKAYAVVVGLLLGVVGVACNSEDPILGCEDTQDCIDQGNSCPGGEELFCNQQLGGLCDCDEGTGGTGGSGGSAGTGGTGGAVNPGACADCVGTDVGPPGEPNTVVSCEPTAEQFLCSCLDGMGTSHDVYVSSAGCQG